MKKSKFTRVIALFLAVLCCFGISGVAVSADEGGSGGDDGKLKPGGISTSKEEMEAYLEAVSYLEYRERYVDIAPGSATVDVDLTKFVADAGSAASLVSNSSVCNEYPSWDGMTSELAAKSVYLPNVGSVTFPVDIPETGMYFISFDYFTVSGTVNSIQRKLFIDGAVPFSEASYLAMSKLWSYDYLADDEGNDVFEEDLNGNSLQPAIRQEQNWRTYVCSDSTGYVNGYFAFYLTAGTHNFRLEAQREAVILGGIKIIPTDDPNYQPQSYEAYYNKMKDTYGATEVPKSTEKTKIEAEMPVLVSDTSVYMSSDRSSAINSPSSSSAQLFNVIGATGYDTVGQWAAYKFKVAASGFYNINMRYQQSALQGMFVCRTLRLFSENRDPAAGVVYGLDNGTPQAPFAEAYMTRFDFSKKWQSGPIGDGNVEDGFLFYFDADTEYTLYVEVGLGSLAEMIKRVEDSLAVINDCYLNIIKLTGASADEFRDYNFSTIMPDVIYHLNNEQNHLSELATEFEELCGTSGSHIATLVTVANLLATMGSDEMNIAKNLATLKSYLGTLGTWINNSKTSKIMVDVISIQSPEAKSPKAKANVFQSIGFEIASFFMSFFTDYDNMGVTDKASTGEAALNVWLASGRDQSKIWRTLIDGGFSEGTGIPVSLKLVTASTLLPSVLAGKGPDVYLGLDSATVINYAIRDAIMSIRGFDDFNTAAYGADGIIGTDDDIYHRAALNTVTLLNQTYGLPLTMNFPMMFYRLDVLVQLGLDVPETWDDILSLLPIFQSNYLAVGVTYTLALDFFLYQKGASMWKYEDNPEYAGAAIGLDTNDALAAFQYCCRLFSEYGFQVQFDAANRFRTGEMPIVISDYISVYNTLTVFATEINGLWEFSSIPGTLDQNGNLNYNSIASITSTVMLHGCRNTEDAWKYMQWQTSADVEAEFGNRMVALIGPSAKYAAANLGAIEKLSWTTKENAAIQDQMDHLSSIVNYPGSYIIARYTDFAFLAVVNKGALAVDTMLGYVETINAELSRKREEFGMKTLLSGQTPEEAEAALNP